MKPRILIFSIAYDPLIGGAELAVRNITDRIFDYEFDLVTCRFERSHKAIERVGNVTVYRVGFPSRLGRLIYPALAVRLARRLHQQNPYQIIWGIMAAYAGAAALMFKKRFPNVKFLLTLQEGDEISHIHRRVTGMRKHWQAIFRTADYIQAISKFLAAWARVEGARCKIEVVPNGVDFRGITDNGLRITNPDNQKKTIITTSRLVKKNGIDILIRAASILKSEIRYPLFVIRILGSGSEENKLKKLAKDLGVEEQIEFFGAVNPSKIPEHLMQADIFVRPSRSEGLGSSFLEAMAAGLPVIGTEVGGIPDFLDPLPTPPHKGEGRREKANLSFLPLDPVPKKRPRLDGGLDGGGQVGVRPNGLFTTPEDPGDLAGKIKLLLENEKLAKQLGENGRKLVEEKYSWDKIAMAMKTIFSQLF